MAWRVIAFPRFQPKAWEAHPWTLKGRTQKAEYKDKPASIDNHC